MAHLDFVDSMSRRVSQRVPEVQGQADQLEPGTMTSLQLALQVQLQ